MHLTEQLDFLFELQCEELPAKAQKNLMTALSDAFTKQCQQQQLNFKAIFGFVSPRRLGFLITRLDAMQPPHTSVKKGPAWHLAFDQNGQPTPQCIGFAKSVGVTPDELEILEINGSKCVAYTLTRKGQSVRECLPAMVQACLKSLPMARRMRWGDQSAEFLRPVHGVIALLDDEVIAMECFGHAAHRKTVGHRFLSPEYFTVQHAKDYGSTLLQHLVMVDFADRQAMIEEQILALANKYDATACRPMALLEEVTGLVEWPRALPGKFDAEFLQLPREVLLAAMQNHQRYFALEHKHSKKIMNHFVFITHLTCDNPELIIQGNERVLRARLQDARFFYEKDRQHTLASRIERLKEVVYQHKLGTLFDKSERVKALMQTIAPLLNLNIELCEQAAMLMKTDLVTEMVGEFPELQGVMGKYYASHDGHPSEIAEAIEEQYVPRNEGNSQLGCALMLADRIDTLVGFFAIGMTPTGDKDPYALRRAALDVVGLAAKEVPLDLPPLLKKSLALYVDYAAQHAVVEDVYAFIMERAKHLWSTLQITADVFQSVITLKPDNVADAFKRMQAVAEFRSTVDGIALAAANKRVKNILDKAALETLLPTNPHFFVLEQEKKLYAAIQKVQSSVTHSHAERLQQLASLRPHVDDFFNHVMVMVDDAALKTNRLSLLAELRALFLSVADIALLH